MGICVRAFRPCVIYVDRKLREMINSVDPNREIGFSLVSCSYRACERAGEAKLVSMLGFRIVRSSAPAVVVAMAFFAVICMVFNFFHTDRCYLCVCVFDVMCMGFLIG